MYLKMPSLQNISSEVFVSHYVRNEGKEVRERHILHKPTDYSEQLQWPQLLAPSTLGFFFTVDTHVFQYSWWIVLSHYWSALLVMFSVFILVTLFSDFIWKLSIFSMLHCRYCLSAQMPNPCTSFSREAVHVRTQFPICMMKWLGYD